VCQKFSASESATRRMVTFLSVAWRSLLVSSYGVAQPLRVSGSRRGALEERTGGIPQLIPQSLGAAPASD